MIVFKCISCGSRLRVSDDKGGKRGKCPKCSMMVRVPRSQVEADATDAHRAEVRARKMSEHRQRREADGDVFSEIVGEVLSSRPAWKSPARHDPQQEAPGVQSPDAPAPGESEAPDHGREVPLPPDETPVEASALADEADRGAEDAPPSDGLDEQPEDAPPSDGLDEQPEAEAPDPEALRRSAEAPSAPPMSWPAEAALSEATGDSGPGSDLDALVQATRAVRTAGSGEGSRASASDDVRTLPDHAEPAQGIWESPAEDAAQDTGIAHWPTAPVRGSHGLLALLVLLAVVAGIMAIVTWRYREHTWRFRDAITRCLPSVKFSSDGAGERARPGCIAGRILLCNEFGGPCSLIALPDPQLVAESADEVGTVIFVRRNDEVAKAMSYRGIGRPPVRRLVGYEMCAVDVASGRRICAAVVMAADDKQAVEALHMLIARCLRRPPPG